LTPSAFIDTIHWLTLSRLGAKLAGSDDFKPVVGTEAREFAGRGRGSEAVGRAEERGSYSFFDLQLDVAYRALPHTGWGIPIGFVATRVYKASSQSNFR
jgi:hypothetical protein